MKKTFCLFAYFFITFSVTFAQNTEWDIAWNEKGATITAYRGTTNSYRGNEGNFSIPQQIAGLPVVGIGEKAFASKQLTSIVIPASVTFLGSGAFIGNTLTSITIPANVNLGTEAIGNNFIEIYNNSGKKAGTYNYMSFGGEWVVIGWTTEQGDGAFIITGYNGNDTAITIPSKWGNFPIVGIQGNQSNSCFGDKQISSVIIPDNIVLIGDNTFAKKQLTSITIPSNLTFIGNSAFASNQLAAIAIPNSVTLIGDSAFASNKLTAITIPNSVTSIGDSVFASNQLTTVTIPSGVTSIGNSAFASNQLTAIAIPNSVTSIGDSAFASNKLTAITIPNSVTSIGKYVFSSNQLSSITISDNITSIDDYAFSNNPLTSVIIGKNVSKIGEGAFLPPSSSSRDSSNQSQLVSITIPANVTVSLEAYSMYSRDYDYSKRSFPGNFGMVYNNGRWKAGTYTSSNGGWVLSTMTITEGTTTIGERVF